jgi:D-methionine transport system substrate-binding protein
MILDQQGIITLASDAEHTATVEDIEENPKNLEFTHIDLLNLTGAYEDGVPLVFNYPTYISSIDLTPEDAVLLEEDEDNTFAIQLVAREDNQDSEEIQAVEEAFTSQEVHDFLMELSEEGHLEPAFEAGE